MTEQRKNQRFDVHLVVRYASAAQFVADHVENLSENGIFVAGADHLPLGHEAPVEIVLPGQGEWTVRARVVFLLDRDTADRGGRNPGAGMLMIEKPPGFDEALLGYLLRLGRRRDNIVMLADVPGGKAIARSGYQTIPLADPATIARLGEAPPGLAAVVVLASEVEGYRGVLRDTKVRDRIFGVGKPAEIPDIIAQIDSLL